MKRYLYVVFVTLFILSPLPTCAESSTYATQIESFVEAVETDDPQVISEFVSYPLIRKYPVPPVDDSNEFVDRYSQLFDDELKRKIVESGIESAWTDMGWRGTMLTSVLMRRMKVIVMPRGPSARQRAANRAW